MGRVGGEYRDEKIISGGEAIKDSEEGWRRVSGREDNIAGPRAEFFIALDCARTGRLGVSAVGASPILPDGLFTMHQPQGSQGTRVPPTKGAHRL